MKWSDIQATPATDAPAPAAEPPRRMKWSDLTQGSPGGFTPSGDARERSGETAQPGLFQRMWDGLSGKDVSRAGRFGMGIGDPVLGIGQAAARAGSAQAEMEGAIGAAGTQEKMPPAMASASGDLDKAIQNREAGYQQREKAAGLSGNLFNVKEDPGGDPESARVTFGDAWARLLGNAASPPNVAMGAAGGAAGAGLGLAGRLGASTAMGAASGAMQPVVTEGNFGAEKAKQVGLGAAGGLAGGAAGEAVGSALGRAIAGNSPQGVNSAILSRYRSTVKPSRSGQAAETQLATQDQRILTAVDQIIKNKANLQLTDEAGNQISGTLPRSLRQFTEALDQTKRSVFAKYDAMAKQAQATNSAVPNPHLVPRLDAATQAEAAAAQGVEQSRRAVGVYAGSPNESRATEALRLAQAGHQRAQRETQAIRDSMFGPSVDLTPAANQLRAIARNTEVSDLHPGLAAEANQLATNFEKRGFYGLGETQDVIQNLNRMLNAFYRNPTAETVSRPSLLGPVVQTLREGLDQAIENAAGPGYQALRLQYGALKSVEKDVAGSVQREANKIPGGIGGIFADYAASEQAIHGVITLSPSALARAGGIKVAQKAMKYINNPNRAIERLFNQAATRGAPPSAFRRGAGAAASYGFPAFGGIGGGLAGADAERPPLGKPRPSVIGP